MLTKYGEKLSVNRPSLTNRKQTNILKQKNWKISIYSIIAKCKSSDKSTSCYFTTIILFKIRIIDEKHYTIDKGKILAESYLYFDYIRMNFVQLYDSLEMNFIATSSFRPVVVDDGVGCYSCGGILLLLRLLLWFEFWQIYDMAIHKSVSSEYFSAIVMSPMWYGHNKLKC